MADDQIDIRITATIDELLSGLQEASAAAQEAFARIGDGASQMSSAVTTSGDGLSRVIPDIEKIAASASSAASGAVSIANALKGLGAGAAAAEVGLGLAAPEILGLAAAAGGVVGAILQLGTAIAGLVKDVINANGESGQLAATYTLLGRASETSKDAIEGHLLALQKIPGLTNEGAAALAAFAAAHTHLSDAVGNQVEQLVKLFADAYGKNAPQAVMVLESALANLTQAGFSQLDRQMLNVTAEQYGFIQGLIGVGDKASAVTAILKILGERGRISFKTLQEQVAALDEKIKESEESEKNIQYDYNTTALAALSAAEATEKLRQQRTALEQAIKNASKQNDDDQQKKELDRAIAINAQLSRQAFLTTDIKKLQADAATADSSGGNGDTFRQAAQREQGELDGLTAKANDENYQKWVELEEAKAAATKAGSAERIAIEQQEVAKAKQQYGDQSTAYFQAQARLVAQRNIAADQQTQTTARTAEQQVAVATKANQQIAESEKEKAAVAAASLQAQQSTEQAYYARRAEEAKAAFAAGKVTLAQEHQAFDDIENEKYASEQRYYAQKWTLAGGDVAKQTALWGEINAAYEAHLAHMAQLDQQYFDKQKHEVQQEGAAWRGVIQEIGSAEDTLVRNIFSKQQSLHQSLIQMGSEFLQKEIANDLKAMTMHILFSNEELAHDKAATQGGFLFQAATSALKMMLGQKEVANTVSTEAAKTAAVAAGATTQEALEQSAAAAGQAAQASSTQTTISQDAAKAFSGVYASVSQIPIVGWILAPIAAAAAFVAVEAMGSGIPSAAGGMVVGGDGLIMAHAQEMVIPASISTGLRDIISAGSFAGAGSWGMRGFAGGGSFASNSGAATSANGGGMNVTFAPQVSALDARSVVALFNNPSIMRQFARNLGAYMTANPSARPAY